MKKSETPIEPSADESYLLYIMSNTEEGITRQSYQFEHSFMQSVRNGIMPKIDGVYENNILETKVGKMAEHRFKQYEYLTVAAITLTTRAVIEGGVSPEKAYAMSDIYLQRLEKCTDTKSMISIQQESLKDFVRQVRLSKEKRSKSSYTEKCRLFVERHLNKSFSLDDIAAEVGIHKNHLSRLFVHETGETVMHYARRLRIDAAKNMLKFSDYSVSAISNYLCFPTQSHFGKVFKNFTGVTPLAFREKNQVC